MNATDELTSVFLEVSRQKLVGEYWPRMCQCLDSLTEEQVWWRPNESSNSVGNLLLHLNGNLRQWILSKLGGVPYERHRPEEFAQREPLSSEELRRQLGITVREVGELFARLTPEDLQKTYDIQTRQNVTAMEAIYHVVEHFAMHYGQIVYVTKLVTGTDLGFYRHLDGKR